MVPPPKGKDLSRMSAPPAVSTTSEPSPVPVVTSPAAGLTATSPSPGGGGAPSPSPRTGKPKGKDFSRMSGPPPSSANTPIPEISQPPPTVPVPQPPMHLQNNDIQMQSTLPTPINNAVGMAGTNLATSSSAYAQSPPLVQTQPPQYQQFMPSAPVNFIQQQQQQQQQLQQQQMQQQQQQLLQQQEQQQLQQQQQQMQQLFHQQQQQQQLLQMQQLQQQMQQPQQQMQQMQLQNQHLQQSANVSLLNMPLKSAVVEPLLPTQRPSWSEARLSTMPNVSRSLSVVGSTGSITAAPVSESTTTTMQQSTSPPNNNKTTVADTDTNDGYGKPSLAPVLGEKLQKLCHSIDPSYTLDSEVQERLVEMADAFVEKVTKDAIKLAKHRGSSCMDVVDAALALKKGYNLEVPGLGPPSVDTGGLGVGGMGGRGTGNVMGGWMFADMVSLGEARGIVGGEGGQEPSPKKTKRGSSTNAM